MKTEQDFPPSDLFGLQDLTVDDFATEWLLEKYFILNCGQSVLSDVPVWQACRSPDLRLFDFLDSEGEIKSSLTAAQIHLGAARIAGLLDRFLPQKSKVVLCFENSPEAVFSFFGCAYANMVSVSGAYPTAPRAVERLEWILKDSQSAAILGKRETLSAFRSALRKRGFDASHVKWISVEGTERCGMLYRHRIAKPEDVALVQYSSGSTGQPKGVMVTHQNLAANLRFLIGDAELRPGARGVIWLPLTHDLGLLTGLLMTMASGGNCLFMRPEDFIANPASWVKMISRYRVNYSAAPGFAYGLCARSAVQAAATLDLSCWEKSIIGADLIESAEVDVFLNVFAVSHLKETVLHPGYGMAEATLVISGSQDGGGVHFKPFSRSGIAKGLALPPENEEDTRLLAANGTPIPHHKVKAVDPETKTALKEGVIGELWVAGPSVAKGYLNNEARTKERFDQHLSGVEGLFFRTGDLGFLWNKEIFVVGRLEYRLRLGAYIWDVSDIIDIIRKSDPALKFAVLAVGCGEVSSKGREKLQIMMEGSIENATPLMAKAIQALRQFCLIEKKSMNLPLIDLFFVRQGSVLKTSSGKIRHRDSLNILTAGEIRPFLTYDLDPEVEILAQEELS